jgi:hypothetical protein
MTPQRWDLSFHLLANMLERSRRSLQLNHSRNMCSVHAFNFATLRTQ